MRAIARPQATSAAAAVLTIDDPFEPCLQYIHTAYYWEDWQDCTWLVAVVGARARAVTCTAAQGVEQYLLPILLNTKSTTVARLLRKPGWDWNLWDLQGNDKFVSRYSVGLETNQSMIRERDDGSN